MKKSKVILTIISLVLVVAMSVAGTLAFLKVTSGPVTNTFSPSNIGLELKESPNTYKMIPGVDMAKDPEVKVTADIATWVFLKVDKVNNPDTYLTYSIDTSVWTQLKDAQGNDVPNVYYHTTNDTEAVSGKVLNVLVGDKVTTKAEVTKTQMDALKGNEPKLVFTAYAVQKDGFATAALAWAEANKA